MNHEMLIPNPLVLSISFVEDVSHKAFILKKRMPDPGLLNGEEEERRMNDESRIWAGLLFFFSFSFPVFLLDLE